MENKFILNLRTLSFDGSGSGQREEYTLGGTLTTDGDTRHLSYEQNEEGVVAKTVISFEKGTPCVLEMEQSGARACFMRFDPAREHKGEYRVAGLPTFPFSIKTRTVKNTVTEDGGRMLLDYEMDFGGARMRMRLTLTATREGAQE